MKKSNEVEHNGAESNNNNGYLNVGVPLGFRFHPTEEELLNFYLKQKVKSYPSCKFAFDHIVPEVDLNQLEPWDIQEKCNVDINNQSDWYFFYHKGKKYPTGMRTNRATKSGFWKATGRDKPIYSMSHKGHKRSCSQQIGLRKTLVFYKGRAPHGTKTNWIMHEYRLLQLDNQNTSTLPSSQEHDGWVVCHIFTKINDNDGRDLQPKLTFLVEQENIRPCSEIFINKKLITNNAIAYNQDSIDLLPQLESPKFQPSATNDDMYDNDDSHCSSSIDEPIRLESSNIRTFQTKGYPQYQDKITCMDEGSLPFVCHDLEVNHAINNKFMLYPNAEVAIIQWRIDNYPFNCEIDLWNF